MSGQEHEWAAEVRGATPVLRCTRCKRVWWPDQRKPRTVCVGGAQ